jgi:hypothetical protein
MKTAMIAGVLAALVAASSAEAMPIEPIANPFVADDPGLRRLRPQWLARTGRRLPLLSLRGLLWRTGLPRRTGLIRRRDLERMPSGILAWALGSLPEYAVSHHGRLPGGGWQS